MTPKLLLLLLSLSLSLHMHTHTHAHTHTHTHTYTTHTSVKCVNAPTFVNKSYEVFAHPLNIINNCPSESCAGSQSDQERELHYRTASEPYPGACMSCSRDGTYTCTHKSNLVEVDACMLHHPYFSRLGTYVALPFAGDNI